MALPPINAASDMGSAASDAEVDGLRSIADERDGSAADGDVSSPVSFRKASA